MAKIERFEDLECWKESRILVKQIFTVCRDNKMDNDFDTKGQLRRAALSIMNNIAEGFGRFSNKQFIQFLGYSEGSATETKSMFYVLNDMEYVERKKIKEMHNQVDKTRKLTLGLLKYLRTRE